MLLHLITLLKHGFGVWGSLFKFATYRPRLLLPAIILAGKPPPSLRRMELRTGTKREWCLNNLSLWGCCKICSILVTFDFAHVRESLDRARDLELVDRPVERPFHYLRTNGDGLEKRSSYSLFYTAMSTS